MSTKPVTYSQVLKNVPLECRDDTIRLLQLLTYSEKSPTVNEVIDALAVDLNRDPPFDPTYRTSRHEQILSLCPNLVTTATRRDHPRLPEKIVLQLKNLSVKEYLTSDKVEESYKAHLHEATARATIIQICFGYLSSLPIDRHCYKEEKAFPLIYYSAREWTSQARAADEQDENVRQLVRKIFLEPDKAFCRWMDLYGQFLWNTLALERDAFQLHVRMYLAAHAGLIHGVIALLESGADVNAPIKLDYGSALQAAVGKGHEKVAKLLIERGADVHFRGGTWNTSVLDTAIGQDQKNIVKILLDNGAARCLNKADFARLMKQVINVGHEDVLIALLDDNANEPPTKDSYNGWLCEAAAQGRTNIAQILIDHGADVNGSHAAFLTPLRQAAGQCRLKMVEFLLENGAQVQSEGDQPCHALQAISRSILERPHCLPDAIELIRMLLAHGADPRWLEPSERWKDMIVAKEAGGFDVVYDPQVHFVDLVQQPQGLRSYVRNESGGFDLHIQPLDPMARRVMYQNYLKNS